MWYAIKTNPNCEKKATAELRRAGIRVYVPKRSYEVRNRSTGQVAVKHRVLLVGYVFIRFPESLLDAYGTPPFRVARECQGVKGFVTGTDRRGEWAPFAVPDKEVIEFIRRQRRREFGRPAVDTEDKRMARLRGAFVRGRRVTVAAGPFEGFLAIIEKLREDGTVDITAKVFGRETRFHVADPEETLATYRPAA